MIKDIDKYKNNNKIELVYEGEQEGAYGVALTLLGNAIKSLYSTYFPKIEKIEKQGIETPYDEIVSWFFNNSDDFEILDDIHEKDYLSILKKIKPLSDFVKKYKKITRIISGGSLAS